MIGVRYAYKTLRHDEVSPELQVAATRILAFAETILLIDPCPDLVWIEAVDLSEVPGPPRFLYLEMLDPRYSRIPDPIPFGGGLTPLHERLNQIWVRNDAEAERMGLPFAILQEWRHAWQKKYHPEIFGNKKEAEYDAYPYAYHGLKEYLCLVGDLDQQSEAMIAAMERKRETWLVETFGCKSNLVD